MSIHRLISHSQYLGGLRILVKGLPAEKKDLIALVLCKFRYEAAAVFVDTVAITVAIRIRITIKKNTKKEHPALFVASQQGSSCCI